MNEQELGDALRKAFEEYHPQTALVDGPTDGVMLDGRFNLVTIARLAIHKLDERSEQPQT